MGIVYIKVKDLKYRKHESSESPQINFGGLKHLKLYTTFVHLYSSKENKL